jgi:TetR/AcrR family fatty acid metabolism transcriptional regulator
VERKRKTSVEERKKQVRKRRQERLQQKKERILDASKRIFAAKGYQLSRIADIARDAEVAYGLVYRYFSSKDRLLMEIFQLEWDRLMKEIKAVADGNKNARAKLVSIMEAMFNYFARDPGMASLMVRDVLRNINIFGQEQIEILEEPVRIINKVIREGQKKGIFDQGIDASMAAVIFYGAIDQIVAGWALHTFPLKGALNVKLAGKMIERLLVNSLEKP